MALAAALACAGAPAAVANPILAGDHPDPSILRTADGWYAYVFRNLEYVHPTGVGVVAPVPQSTGSAPTDRIMTMTSCNPLFSAQERIIAYSLFEKFYPRAEGAPAEIAAIVSGKA